MECLQLLLIAIYSHSGYQNQTHTYIAIIKGFW